MGPRKRKAPSIDIKKIALASKQKNEEDNGMDEVEDDDDEEENDNTSRITQGIRNQNTQHDEYGREDENGEDDEDEIPEQTSTENGNLNSLSELKIFKEKDIREAIANLPPKFKKETQLIYENYEKEFTHWKFQLMNGFNLLFHGFGSKKELLHKFASKKLKDGAAIVIHGYNPLINMKQILLEILSVLILRLRANDKNDSKNLNQFRAQSVKSILSFFSQQKFLRPVYLIVHNIDGQGLKEKSNQSVLSELASCSYIKFVASVDNIHAPLMWDNHMATKEFNWWWHHTPTYQPYKHEAVFMPPLLSTSLCERTTDGALIVLKTLTANSRSIFQILANFLLTNTDEPGLSFQRWYTLCREKFVVNNDLTLRTHLTEFKDHEIVKVRKASDGQDCFYAPFSKELLQKLIQDINN